MIRSQFLQTCDAEIEKKVLEGLIHASKQRSYLNHCAIAFLIDYVLNVEEDHFRDRVWPILEKEVFKPWKDHNLDSLHLLLTLQKKFPNIITGKEIKKRCGSKEIVSKTNVAEILRILIVRYLFLISFYSKFKSIYFILNILNCRKFLG